MRAVARCVQLQTKRARVVPQFDPILMKCLATSIHGEPHGTASIEIHPWRGPCPTVLTQRVYWYFTYTLLAAKRINVCNFGHVRPWVSGNLHRHGRPSPPSSSPPVNQKQPGR